MDGILTSLKNALNQMEEKYTKQPGPNTGTRMMNYFLRSKEKEDLVLSLVTTDANEPDSDDDDDEDDDSSVGSLESDDEELENSTNKKNKENNKDDEKCGTILESAWKKRSKALRHDVAISAWMCCPLQEVMADCKNNHTGEHRLAVTRLLRRWFGHL